MGLVAGKTSALWLAFYSSLLSHPDGVSKSLPKVLPHNELGKELRPQFPPANLAFGLGLLASALSFSFGLLLWASALG